MPLSRSQRRLPVCAFVFLLLCIAVPRLSIAANSARISTPGVTITSPSLVLLFATADNALNTASASHNVNDSQSDNSHVESFLVVFVLFIGGWYIFLRSIGAGTRFYIGPDGRSHGTFLITSTMFGGRGGGYGGGGFAGGGGGFGGGGASGGW